MNFHTAHEKQEQAASFALTRLVPMKRAGTVWFTETRQIRQFPMARPAHPQLGTLMRSYVALLNAWAHVSRALTNRHPEQVAIPD